MAEARVSTTVDPETVVEETATGVPLDVIAYVLVAAFVALNASLYVRVSVTPSAARTELTKVGGAKSTGVTDTDADAAEVPTLFTASR